MDGATSDPVELIDLTQDTPERRSSVRMQVASVHRHTNASKAKDERKKASFEVAEATIASTRRRRSSVSKRLECPICMEDISTIVDRGSWLVAFTCGHVYCQDCNGKILKLVNPSCPKCKLQNPKSIRLYL